MPWVRKWPWFCSIRSGFWDTAISIPEWAYTDRSLLYQLHWSTAKKNPGFFNGIRLIMMPWVRKWHWFCSIRSEFWDTAISIPERAHTARSLLYGLHWSTAKKNPGVFNGIRLILMPWVRKWLLFCSIRSGFWDIAIGIPERAYTARSLLYGLHW